MTKIRAYLRILVCGLALQAGQLPAAADWLYTPGGGPSKFMSFNASSSPVAGTGACAAANVDCMVFSPVNTAGAPLFTSTTPGRVDPTGSTTQPVSAASLPLPTGAATSALQGTGNTSLASILTALGSPFQAGGSIGNTGFNALQGGAANAVGNPFFMSPATGATFPISAASLPLPTGAATQTTLASLLTALGTPFQAGGNIGNTSFAVTQATAANLNMTCANCSGSGASAVDEATYVPGSPTVFAPGGMFFQTTATNNALTNLQNGMWQGTANRAGFVNLRNASGAEIGVAAAPVQVSLANTASNATAVSVSGTVTANAGTNLNTSALALETGGNLAQIVTDLGPPGATACATDTSSCSVNQLMQRLAQRLSTINTTLGTPFQAGGSIGNTTFAATQATSSNLKAQVDPLTIATWGLAPVAAGTAPTNAQVIGCIQASPTPSANQSVAVSCDAAGNVKVVGTGILDTSSFSQPTTQGSGVLGLVNTSARSGLTNATMSYLSLDATAALRVAIVSGAGSGGTASNFGSAFPTAGTAMGASDGTNMVGVRASNYGTSPGAVTALATNSFVTNTVPENLTQFGGSTLSASNPLPSQLSQGGAVLSATNGLFGNLLQGNAVLSATNPIFSRSVASSAGGCTPSGAVVPNNTTAVVVKSGAGTLCGVQVYGLGAAPAYLKFYNATSATCGSGTPIKRLMIPAASTAANGAGSNVTFADVGVAFSTGITYCITTGITDADNTAPAASTFLVNVDTI